MTKTSRRGVTFASGGSVLLIAGLLIGSSIVRVFSGATAAFAEQGGPVQLDLDAAPTKPSQSKPADRGEIAGLLEALQRREADIVEQTRALDMREKSLELAQEQVERRLAALEQAEERLRSTLAIAETAAEDDLSRLTTVYENMKPKDAAAVFGAMEPEFAAGFLARMKPDAAAKIMSGLDPQTAYSISAILAGRNANAPKS